VEPDAELGEPHLVGQRSVGSLLQLVLVLGNESGVNLDFRRGERWGGDKLEGLVAIAAISV
jgi:hypothetical protein